MNFHLKGLAAFILCAVLLGLLPTGFAVETRTMAEDLTADTDISGTGYGSFGFLKDGDLKEYQESDGNTTLTLKNEKGIGGVYLMFDLEYGEYTVVNNDTGTTAAAGKDGILHEFVDMKKLFGSAPKSVTLRFESGKVRLSEIRCFTPGDTPDSVQRWDAPWREADLVLFAAHGDDDQLYFAGLLPKYTARKDCAVQVVYLTDHRNTTNVRTHEMLNGLWSVGVRAYPVFGRFADFRIDSLQETYNRYAQLGTSKEELQSFVVEQIRRFKPKVVVTHDFNGEYGHGMHRLYADLVTRALDLTGDAGTFPESAEKYGTWEVLKTYVHLYPENPVVIDYDTPMEELGGLTPFEVTQKYGFPCHESQQWGGFVKWLNGSRDKITIHKASGIATYSPCRFGLYRSTVGADAAKDDFLENVETYAQQHAREEEERRELEKAERQRLAQIMVGLTAFEGIPLNESERPRFDAVKTDLETMDAGTWNGENKVRMESLHQELEKLKEDVRQRLEQEREEKERLKREEKERLEREEKERLEREEKERLEREEKERLEREEQERQEQEKLRSDQVKRILIAALTVPAVLAAVLIWMRARNIRRHKKRAASQKRK